MLVIPNSRWGNKRPRIMLVYGILLITRILKDIFSFEILDANGQNYTEEEVLRYLKEKAPDIVLISALSVEYYNQWHSVAELTKKSCHSCITVMGGVYPTVMEDKVLDDVNVDYLFFGHAEERLDVFLKAVCDNGDLKNIAGIAFRENDSIRKNSVNSFVSDVKDIVRPDYSLIDYTPYLVQKKHGYQFNSQAPGAKIITSYGCPHNCVFCAVRTINGRHVVFRPLEDIYEEIDYLRDSYNIEELTFMDDTFFQDKKRVTLFLNELIKRDYKLRWKAVNVAAWHLDDELLELMKESGCYQITISVESGSQRVLSKIIHKPLKLGIVKPLVKKTKELGIFIGGNFVFGLPGETWDEILQTVRFAEECDFDIVQFFLATPQPKTDLYEIAKDGRYIPDDFSFMDSRTFGFGQGFISTDEFTPFELMVLRAFEWDRINFKSPEKTERIAKFMDMSIDEINDHRKQTRLSLGRFFNPVDDDQKE